MKSPAGWEKRLLSTLFITLFLIIITQIPAVAFGPVIVDVTTKSFSVVWTTGGNYDSCGINVHESDVEEDQIVVETATNFPGEAGRQFGLAKVTVVGLNVDTVYHFNLVQDGNEQPEEYSVKTENLRGLQTTDPGNSDIVSNDVVHKAVYKSDGKSPATGALVMAEIFNHDVDPELSPTNTLSDYPITAWVGDGMIGDEGNTYNPNNISYKQYAALNMNNLFGTDHFPLSLQGDNPDTPENESEIVKFTIVHGTLPVLGQGSGGAFTSLGRINYVEKSGGEKITTAKVSASFKFHEGGNPFAFPFTAPLGYTTGDLLEAIEEAEGEIGIVKSIWAYPGSWVETYQSILDLGGGVVLKEIIDPAPLPTGSGCFIIMNEDMTKEVVFYGTPDSAQIKLNANSGNLISIPQIPVYYETGDLLLDIEGLAGAGDNSIKSISSHVNGWVETYKSVLDLGGGVILIDIIDSAPMSSSNFVFVILNDSANNVEDWVPFGD